MNSKESRQSVALVALFCSSRYLSWQFKGTGVWNRNSMTVSRQKRKYN